MAELSEPLRTRILAQPSGWPPLKRFSCGRGGKPWERTVNEWAHRAYRGKTTERQTIVALEDADARLIGLSSIKPGPLRVRGTDALVTNAAYIHMIGTDRLYHGRRLTDGTSPGDALLVGTLEIVPEAWDGLPISYVWALINRDNGPCQALFSRHHFHRAPGEGSGDDFRYLVPSPFAASRRRATG